MEGVQDALFLAGSQMEDFRSKNHILNISEEGISLYQELQAIEKDYSNISLQLSYYDYLVDYLQSDIPVGSMVSPSTAEINDPALSAMIIQLNQLNRELIIASSNASDINPQVSNLRKQIRATLRSMRENVMNLSNTTKLRQSELEFQINQAERELNKLPKIKESSLTYNVYLTSMIIYTSIY